MASRTPVHPRDSQRVRTEPQSDYARLLTAFGRTTHVRVPNRTAATWETIAASLAEAQLEGVAGTLLALLRLPNDWDGENGRPPTQDVADRALSITRAMFRLGMPAPHIVPETDGTIALEWSRGTSELEIEIGPNQHVSVFAQDPADGWRLDEEGLSGLVQVPSLVRRLRLNSP